MNNDLTPAHLRSITNACKSRSPERIRVEKLEYGESIEFGELEFIKYRSIVSRLNRRKDIPFHYSINKLPGFEPRVYSVYMTMSSKEWERFKADRENRVRIEKILKKKTKDGM